MTKVSIFAAIADLATGAKARRDAEYDAFLVFYRELVETVSNETVKLFGNLKVDVIDKGVLVTGNWGIELSATDYIWWQTKIKQEGARFSKSIAIVQASMLTRLAKRAEAEGLTPDERKKLVALLDETVPA